MTTVSQLRFGANHHPDNAKAAWGARMIDRRPYPVDFVHDRQDCAGPALNDLLERLNVDGVLVELKARIDSLRTGGRFRPTGDGEDYWWQGTDEFESNSTEVYVIYDEDGLVATATTYGSYGYVYVSAWLEADR